MTSEIVVLRLVHVLSGIFWVGSGLFSSIFLMPVLLSAGPTAGAVLGGLQARKLFVVLPTVALLTIASGARLMWIVSGSAGATYFASRMGQALSWSALAATIAFLLSLLISRPAMAKAGQLAAELSKVTDDARRAQLSATVTRLRNRGGLAGKISMGLLVLSACGMAVARYL